MEHGFFGQLQTVLLEAAAATAAAAAAAAAAVSVA
jgi:hypothetical protein